MKAPAEPIGDPVSLGRTGAAPCAMPGRRRRRDGRRPGLSGQALPGQRPRKARTASTRGDRPPATRMRESDAGAHGTPGGVRLRLAGSPRRAGLQGGWRHGTRYPGRRQGPRLHPPGAVRRPGAAPGPARRAGRRAVLLSPGRHPRLHRRGLCLPRQLRGLRRRRRRGDRGQFRLGRQARGVRRQARAAFHAAQRSGWPGPQALRGPGGARPAARPGHLRDRPPGHGPARVQFHDQHRPACR